MKCTEIKHCPLTNLKPEAATYRELDGKGLYFESKPVGRNPESCATKSLMASGRCLA